MIIGIETGNKSWVLKDSYREIRRFPVEEFFEEGAGGARYREKPPERAVAAFTEIIPSVIFHYMGDAVKCKRLWCLVGFRGNDTVGEEIIVDSCDIFIMNDAGKTIERL